ncbi:hypothetical protein PS1_025283 [Malus domestica]
MRGLGSDACKLRWHGLGSEACKLGWHGLGRGFGAVSLGWHGSGRGEGTMDLAMGGYRGSHPGGSWVETRGSGAAPLIVAFSLTDLRNPIS